MRSGLIDLGKVLDELAGTDVVGLPDEDVRTGLPALLTAFNQISALVATVVASFDTRDLSEPDGFKTTTAWLIAFGRMTGGAAAGWLTRGRLLRELPAVHAAATHGHASTEHIGRIVELTRRVDLPTVKHFDTLLADLAAATRPADVTTACNRIAAHKDPDGKPPDPERDFNRRELHLTRRGNMYAIRGRLDLEGGATLATAIDALLKPPPPSDERTAPQRRADALVELARLGTTASLLPTVGGVRPSLGILITPETLLDIRARATEHLSSHGSPSNDTGTYQPPAPDVGADSNTRDGLVVPEHAQAVDPPDPADDEPPPVGHQRSQHLQPRQPSRRQDALAAAGIPELPEAAWLNWAGAIPTTLAQRLACDCDVWRVVLDPGTGLPLEVGRAHRLVPHWMRKALHARDRGCRWPGCDAPVSWTDAHHLISWFLGGRTDIDKLISLCRWHHVKVHEGQWSIRLDPATGEVHVTRPDGTPYELGPSQPHTTPTRTRAA
jgi:hypothetical protein